MGARALLSTADSVISKSFSLPKINPDLPAVFAGFHGVLCRVRLGRLLPHFLLKSGRGADVDAHLSLVSRVAVLDKVTDFLFFLGKLLIVGSVGKCWGLEVSPRDVRLL